MTTSKVKPPKRKPPFSLVLPDDLEAFLRAKAGMGYRSMTKEITMRLEQSRMFDEQPSAIRADPVS
jgi:hypothetical protein